MALSVQKLNGDSTFLLTFSAIAADPSPPSATFTILVDPWLSGPSQIWHPKFSFSRHTVPSCIGHLSEIPPPNVVLISQDKPDHCHEATLRQLPPSLPRTLILAEPGAAKKIRSWKYFPPEKVHALPIFSDEKPSSMIRFQIPGLSSASEHGEATVAFIPAKRDLTGLHNAIGITYRPPTAPPAPYTAFSSASSSSTSQSLVLPVQRNPSRHLPPTPPDSPPLTSAPMVAVTSSEGPTSPNYSPEPYSHPNYSSDQLSYPATAFSFHNLSYEPPTSQSHTLHTPSSSTATAQTSHLSISSSTSDLSSPATTLPPNTPIKLPTVSSSSRPKTLSVIYSPHGVSYPLIAPYASSHLISTASLPLTLLLHSFDRVTNPWWLGGNISAGVPGGVEIARNLFAKTWISAHDEDKESSGISVGKIVTRKWGVEEVRREIAFGVEGAKGRAWGTNVRVLGVGEELSLGA